MKLPLIIEEMGNITFFANADAIANKLEVIDVCNATYRLFDGDGREHSLDIGVSNGRERVEVEQQDKPVSCKDYLVECFAHCLSSFGESEEEMLRLSFEELRDKLLNRAGVEEHT